MFTVDQLLTPVSAERPCGEDLAFSSEVDAIAKARQADDPSIEQGEWVTTLKEADWKFVATRCAKLIETRSKDLQLAVWLAEASAKTAGLRALGDSLRVIAGLCERYWDQVLPLPDESGFEQRVGNLCWIAARVPQLAREMPLTEGASAAYSLRDFEGARTRQPVQGESAPDLEGARRRTSRKFYQALLDDLEHCQNALAQLEQIVDERLGADGPSFTAARGALQDVAHFVTPSAREQGAATVAAAGAPQVAGVVAGAEAAGSALPPPALGAAVQTRAQALAQLRLVAEFFRRTEPHSPVAYLAEKAAHWGEQPLHVWLRGVVKDEAVFAQLEEVLGVKT